MRLIIAILLFASMAVADEDFSVRKGSLQSLYTSLDPTSVTQHFAFYELYPDTPLGKEALRHAWALLRGGQHPEILPPIQILPIIAFVNRTPGSDAPVLDGVQLEAIGKLAQHLPNRQLPGSKIWDLGACEKLPPEEIDLARGLFLSEMAEDTPAARQKVESYEANIDLMALQILARLPDHPAPAQIIRAINDYIFEEMRFRFPPHSLYAKDIDVYTLLPSVLDSRQGVCLGVSILYLSLAQRLGLPLTAITPPGHIFVRYRDPKTNETINIETTARGIDLPDEVYLGIDTRKLQERTIREVIGLALMNQASVSWRRKDFASTIDLYMRALKFLPDDVLLKTFLGFNYLFAGRTEEGKALLKTLQGVVPDHMVGGDTVGEDFLAGKTDAEGILAIYTEIDEKRSSILEKQKLLESVVAKFPAFRQGILHLAITHLQLGREKEALPILERYIALCPNDPVGNYYLAAIHMERFNTVLAWKYLRQAEKIVLSRGHHPRALKELREALVRVCPEPNN